MVNMGEIFAHDRINNVPMDRVPLSVREGRFLLQAGDLLFARQSLVVEGAGKCSIFLAHDEPATFESHIIRCRLDRRRADPDYYYYFFKSKQGKQAISEIVIHGAAASGIRGSDLSVLSVPCPQLSEQQKVASNLGALDDRIALLRATNRTLEDMARLLFRAWFVEFEPVRAKMEGRAPTSCDPATAALFPDRLVESEIGEVPNGWNISTIGEQVRVVGGSTPSTADNTFWNGQHHWATPKDLSTLSSPVLLDTERKITDAGLAKISSGQLPVGSVLLSSRAPIGYLALAQVPVAINQGFIGMICDKRLSNLFVLHWAEDNLDHIKNRANGTTFMEISKSNFRPMQVVVPPVAVMRAFDAVVAPMMERVVLNLRAARDLASTRDELLPRLMSGALTAPETA